MATYYISNLTELNNIRNDLAGDYILTDHIDASATTTWNAGKGWEPIGTDAAPFTGSFDGQQYIISDLFIDRHLTTDTLTTGFFGTTSSTATLTNIRLTDVDITGRTDFDLTAPKTGGIVGDSGATITLSYVSGSVTGKCEVGGFVGRNTNNGDISRCHANVTCQGTQHVGGFVGTQVGSIANCCAYGNVTQVDYGLLSYNDTGGFVGGNYPSGIKLENCYASGNVSGTKALGGFVGYDEGGGVWAKPTGCFSVGSVSGTTDVGGFLGQNAPGGVIDLSNCSWATPTATNAIGGNADNVDPPIALLNPGGYGWDEATTAAFKSITASIYAGASWDISELATHTTEIWTLDGSNYPDLRLASHPYLTISGSGTYLEGQPANLRASSSDIGGETVTITWSSSKDGYLGEGTSLNADLSVGTHTITAVSTNESSLTYTKTMTVRVSRIALSFSIETSESQTTALDERTRFIENETFLSFSIPSTTAPYITYWRIYEYNNPSTAFTVSTTVNGPSGTNLGNITSGSLTSLGIVLDRTRDYYVQVKVNTGEWTDPVLLDMQSRSIYAKHRAGTTVSNSPTGARVEQTSPLYAEQTTNTGIKITNLVYTGQQTSGNPTETNSSTGVIIRNS